MKKIIQSVEPSIVAASGLDEEAVAQASLSSEKDITKLLGEHNEAEDRISRDGRDHKGGTRGDR